MPNEPYWLPLEIIIRANAAEVARTREPHHLLNPGLLESAWAKPRNRWSYEGEEDLLTLAVSLMQGVAQNHPFQQGNKRTAFQAGVLFMRLNGLTIDKRLDSADLADALVALIEHATDEAGFVAFLRPHIADYDDAG